LVGIEIIGKEEKTSIIRSTIEYEVHHEHANNLPVDLRGQGQELETLVKILVSVCL